MLTSVNNEDDVSTVMRGYPRIRDGLRWTFVLFQARTSRITCFRIYALVIYILVYSLFLFLEFYVYIYIYICIYIYI